MFVILLEKWQMMNQLSKYLACNQSINWLMDLAIEGLKF